MPNLYDAYKKYRVEANSLEEFLSRYTKPRAHADRGKDYVAARIKSHS